MFITKRARITPNLVHSQYSKGATLLSGYNLTIEGGTVLHFHTHEEARGHALSHNLLLAYSGEEAQLHSVNKNKGEPK